MKYFLVVTCCFVLFNSYAQKDKKAYKSNQHIIDQNYGGIGMTFIRPNLGQGVAVPNRWYGISLVSDFLETEFLMGEVSKVQPLVKKDAFQLPVNNYGTDFGYLLSTGVSFPINFLTVGSYKNAFNVFRGHPVIGGNLGFGTFKHADESSGKSRIYYLGLNVGYRLRLPVGSLEFSLKGRLGWSGVDDFAGTGYDFYKGTGISPAITFRFDAMKGLLNPTMVSMNVQQATVSNVESNTTRTSSRYVGNKRIDSYSTTTTGDVNVTSGNIGVQDVGPHIGFGPKVSFMNPIRSNYIKPSFLFGIVAEGRANVVDFGLTLEGGNVGHGSALRFTGVDEPKRKLDKKDSNPLGTVSVVNFYANLGFDISPAFFVPFGIVIDKGESTSFFTATAGFNFGVHGAFNQQYDNPIVADFYVDLAAADEIVKDKFYNPADVGTGFLGGFYFSLQVGATSFKVTNYRYYGAPFASTTMLSVAWRFPVLIDGFLDF
ncbi:MAG: hypothetical protein AB8B74_08650 [Crocinitomicaceae bacterium]